MEIDFCLVEIEAYYPKIKFTMLGSNLLRLNQLVLKSSLNFWSQNQILLREGQTLQSWYWIYYFEMEFAESEWLAH